MFNGKPYIIAEVAQNHEGSLGQAHAFIDAVATTCADAIKFQTHIAEEESTPDEPFRVNFSYEDKTRYDYWKRMEFTSEEWSGLYQHATEKGLAFLSSPFSVKALEMLDRLGVPAWKLGSGEVFNWVLLQKAIITGKPIVLSTGLSVLEEIDVQVAAVQEHGNELLLMQCVTEYPAVPEHIDISLIPEYRQRYNCPVGISDHSATIYPALAAVTLGAAAVEVHVTLSKYMFGPDVKASVTLEQLQAIVEGSAFIHTMRQSRADRHHRTTEKDELKRIFSKSIYLSKDLDKGAIIKEDCISLKKPQAGIDAARYAEVLGKKMKSGRLQGTPLQWEDIE